MPQELAERASVSTALQEKVLLGGDLSKLTTDERMSYYKNLCESLGLNPLTRPFEYLTLNGKMVLYARKDCTEQLRTSRKVSVTIVSREVVEGVYVVTARASETGGRCDESIGAVPIDKLTGNDRANAMMKAETKAKRRVTLSICGLGMLDETEIETIKSAKTHAIAEAELAGATMTIPQVRPPVGNRDMSPPITPSVMPESADIYDLPDEAWKKAITTIDSNEEWSQIKAQVKEREGIKDLRRVQAKDRGRILAAIIIAGKQQGVQIEI